MRAIVLSTLAVLAAAAGASAWEWEPETPVECGSWVGMQVEVDGHARPLYAAADGNRHYVEARAGARYELRLTNRTGQRIGVKVAVDGLNVISGERDHSGIDRMYVLGPWESTAVRGWRTSLESVRSFTFVDERASYAARSGKANGKMGWIEVVVFRERQPAIGYGYNPWMERRQRSEDGAAEEKDAQPSPRDHADAANGAAAAPPAAKGQAEGLVRPAPGRSFPGTGWGDPMHDQVRLVDFDAEPTPVENVTVRYEYRAALQALGILPRYEPRDRLSQREGGEWGFAQPPRW
jgi:hypothetical protein